MVEATTVLVILIGAFLLFFGAAFSSYGVSVLGLVVGGASGYLLGPSVAGAIAVDPTLGIAGMIIVGALAGVLLSIALLSLAVAGLAFVVGSYVGFVVVAAAYVDGGIWLQAPVAIGVGLVCALIGLVLTKTMMVLVTAFVGASLASTAIGVAELQTAATEFNPDPLVFDPIAPLFLGLFVLGVLSQFGLFKFGYVTKLLSVLPGVRPLRDGSESQ